MPRSLYAAVLLLAACMPAQATPRSSDPLRLTAPNGGAPAPLVGPATDTATWSITRGATVGVRRFTVLGALSRAMLDTEIARATGGRGAVVWLSDTSARVATTDGLALVRIAGQELSVVQARCDPRVCDGTLETALSALDASGWSRYLALGCDTSLSLPASWRVLDPRSGGTLLRDSATLEPMLRAAVATRIGFSLDPTDAYIPHANLMVYAVAAGAGLDDGAVALDMTLWRYARDPDQTIETFAATAPSFLDTRGVTTPAGEALEVRRMDAPRPEIDDIVFVGDSSYLFRFSATQAQSLDAAAFRAIVGTLVTTTVLVSTSAP